MQHKYSIIERPELLSDKQYRDWFLNVKAQGTVKIHPPKAADNEALPHDHKRPQYYFAVKHSKKLQREQQTQYYKKMTARYTEETADFFFTPPHLFQPNAPHKTLHIKKYDKKGVALSELEQVTVVLFVWAYQSAECLAKKHTPASVNLKKRMRSIADKAFETKGFLHAMDIRTHAELIAFIKECSSDIAELKQDVARQNAILAQTADIMDAISRYENQHDSAALTWLQQHRCSQPEEIAATKKRYSRAEARLKENTALLESRKTEYRHLKETEALLHPASYKAEWDQYLQMTLGHEVQQKYGYVDDLTLSKQMHQIGKIMGIPPGDMDRYLSSAKEDAAKATWLEYREFVRLACSADDNSKAISDIYAKIKNKYLTLRMLQQWENAPTPIGPVSLILLLVTAFVSGMAEAALSSEIEELRWEAEIQKEYAKETRRTRREALREAKAFYDTETAAASEEEIAASRIRFYRTAATIIGRYDITQNIDDMLQKGSLDAKIEEAVRQQLQITPSQKKRKSKLPER